MYRILHGLFLVVLSSILTFHSIRLVAQERSIFELVRKHPDARMILIFEVDSLKTYKMQEKDYPSLFCLATASQNIATISCKISARGSYRKRNCFYPPLKLNFVKGDLKDMDMEKYDEYKLVSECLDNDEAYLYLLKEYLVYRLYAELTPYAYGTTHFNLEYRDVDSDRVISSYGFLIESEKELKNRLDGKWCDCDEEVMLDSYDHFQLEVFTMFQYMIGNRDVAIGSGHNVDVLVRKADSLLIPIPYDFDFSLFVDSPYAFPEEEDKIEPTFLGYERNQHLIDSVFQLFLEKKDLLLEIIDTFEPLPKRIRRECAKYVENFYQEIADREYQMTYVH